MAVDGPATVASRRGETYGGRSREQRAAERRERIVAASVHLFGTRAYDDVTVADICARGKVSKRYFYQHFVDREDLLSQVHRELNDWLMQGMAAAVPERASSLAEFFRPSLRALVGMLRDHPERARVIYVNAPRMETRRRGVLREDAQFVAGILRRAGDHPEDRIGYDRKVLAMVAGITEVLIDWMAHDMTDDPEVLTEHLTQIALALAGGR